MATQTRAGGAALTAGILELTLATALIHASLGGTLFLLNAAGYLALALALVVAAAVPHPLVRRYSWLPRVGLAAYAAATIVGYVVMGPYFILGWVAKLIEVAIITLLVADLARIHGSVGGTWRAIRETLGGTRASGAAPS
jgi:hypothetical protein